MKVAWALPCRHIEALPDRSYALMGVVSDVRVVADLPQIVAVPLLVNITATHLDHQDEHRLSVVVTSPEMEPVIEPLEVTFRVTPSPHTPPGWGGQTIIPLQIVFSADTYGPYSIDIRVDDQAPHSVPIIVRDVPPQPS